MKEQRYISAILMIAIAILVNAFLAAIFSLLPTPAGKTFAESFRQAFVICFLLFGGGFAVGAVLILATRLSDDSALKYGSAFYYGAAFCAYILTEYLGMADFELALLVSAVISGLVCYNFWLKNKSDTE